MPSLQVPPRDSGLVVAAMVRYFLAPPITLAKACWLHCDGAFSLKLTLRRSDKHASWDWLDLSLAGNTIPWVKPTFGVAGINC